MMKQSWKVRAMGREAAETLRSSKSLRQAAKRLHVNVSTLSRAVKAGKLPPPNSAPLEAADALKAASAAGASFAEWARETFELSRAELELVTLAQAALTMAHDPETPPALKLAAAREFRSTLAALALPAMEAPAAEPAPRPPAVRVSGDPRPVLFGGGSTWR